MPRTLFDKIWDQHLVAQRADGRDIIYIDRHVLHELHAPHAFEQLQKQERPVRRPDLTFSMQDHTVATKPGRDDSTNPSGAPFLKAMREGSRRNGIKVFDIDDRSEERRVGKECRCRWTAVAAKEKKRKEAKGTQKQRK